MKQEKIMEIIRNVLLLLLIGVDEILEFLQNHGLFLAASDGFRWFFILRKSSSMFGSLKFSVS